MLPTIKIKTIKANVLFAILNMRLNVIGSNCLREQLDFDSWMDIPQADTNTKRKTHTLKKLEMSVVTF